MTKISPVFLVGAHMSISGGVQNAILAGESIGCTCIQLFTHSNRQWAFPKISDSEVDLFKQTWQESSIRSVMVHASYLLNIGSSAAELRTKSTKALIAELTRCQLLNIPHVVLHPGSAGTSSEGECLLRITEELNIALQQVPGHTMILLENTAGQGSSVGYSFEQLALILASVEQKKRVGICFDTCHAFVAGYDFRTPATYERLWKEFDDIIGLSNLKAMHLNDSKKGTGSNVDRHEHIGKGMLGLEAFRLICNDERFFDIPKVLETPKDQLLVEDSMNLSVLQELLSPKNRKLLQVSL